MKKFKIGDRVRVKSTFDGVNLAGKTGTIVNINEGGLFPFDYAVEFDEKLPDALGHDCHGKAKDGHGRFGYEHELELVKERKFKVGDKVIGNAKSEYAIACEGWRGEVTKIFDDGNIQVSDCFVHFTVNPECFDLDRCERKIVITSDGVTTLARLYDGKKVIKSAEAKCSPDDAFDFDKGAKIAFERLIGEGEAKTEEKSKYKVGDKVVVKKNICYHDYKIGERLTLKRKMLHSGSHDGSPTWHVVEGTTYVCENDIEPYEEPKYYCGKAVCTKSDSDFIVGKVYEFVDGLTTDEKGTKRPATGAIKTLIVE